MSELDTVPGTQFRRLIMSLVTIEGVVIYATENQFEWSSAFVLRLETTSTDAHAPTIYVSFDSVTLQSELCKMHGSTIVLQADKMLSKNQKHYYNLVKIDSLSHLTDSELVREEERLYLKDFEKKITPYFHEQAEFVIGSVVVGKKKFENSIKKSGPQNIEFWVVTEISKDCALLMKNINETSRTATLKTAKSYLRLSQNNIRPFFEDTRLYFGKRRVDEIEQILNHISLEQMEIIENRHNENSTFSIFDYFNDSDQHRFTMRIGEFIRKYRNEIINDKKPSDLPECLNTADRTFFAKKFLKGFDYSRMLAYDYVFKYKPSEDLLILDIAKEIDYLLPRHYFRYLRDKYKNSDMSENCGEYLGIHFMEGLKYQYVDNYIRDSLAFDRSGTIILDVDEKTNEIVRAMLRDHGYVLKKELEKYEIEKVLMFLFHDIMDDCIFDLIQFE